MPEQRSTFKELRQSQQRTLHADGIVNLIVKVSGSAYLRFFQTALKKGAPLLRGSYL